MGIKFDDKRKVFFLTTQNSEYQIAIGDGGVLLHAYYGKPVCAADMSYLLAEIDRGFSGNYYEMRDRRGFSPDTLPQEYSTFGAGDYRVPALVVEQDNGSRTLDLRYKEHRIVQGRRHSEILPYVRENSDETESLEIDLFDEVAGLTVTLIYNVFASKDVITRSSVIANTSGNTCRLLKAASMSLDITYKKMDLIHFHGRHAMERQMERSPLTHDVHMVGSSRGTSSHHNNPFVILCDRGAGEDYGECYGFMLMYSGNHAQEVEVDQSGSIRMVSGIGREDFTWKLYMGEAFETPEVIMTYSSRGLGQLSRNYHRIIRENVCPPEFNDYKRPVIINNWEGTYFGFDDNSIKEMMYAARQCGCEMFVLDDGWFGKRDDDNSGLGDWYVNMSKLPCGISGIADYAEGLGLKFGLWFEPEMINEDSDLFREHPDYVLRDPDRKPVMARNQMVLDMSRPEVVENIFCQMKEVLDGADISYIKWDFNRSLSNVYSVAAGREGQGEVAHRFVLGTYSLLKKIRETYPGIMIEGCSGGGGRFDAGMLLYTPQIWCSDNSEAINRLRIQEGTCYGYPVSTVGSHVSASPNHQNGREVPIATRAIVAMSGTFGYELDPRELTEDEKEEIRKQIDLYNGYYSLIQNGDYFRISDEYSREYFTAWSFVAGDKTEALLNLVVTDVRANPEIPFVKLKGLDPLARYRIDNIYSSIKEKPPESGFRSMIGVGNSYSGAALMNGGLALDPMYGVYPAIQIHLIKV
jgi:alpha-galactosidase